MAIKRLEIFPTLVAAGAIYPYSDSLLEMGSRCSTFGDDFQMFRVIGTGTARRILVPRNMAPYHSDLDYSVGLSVAFKSKFVPRNDEQTRVISESVDLLREGESFVAQCPTGFGKTACAMDIIAKMGKKTLVIVTKEDLRDQWIEACKKFLGLTSKEIGLIQANTFQVAGKKVVIALVHSLAKEDRYPAHSFKEFGLAIWDEVHRVGADNFSQSCYRVPAALRLGLSATPDRKDGKWDVVNAHIGHTMVKTEAAPMIPKIIARRSPWTLPQVKVVGKDGQAKVGPLPHSPGKCGHVINMLVKHHGRNAMLVEFIASAYKKGRCIVVQSDRLEHLETLSMMAQKHGVPPGAIGYYVGGMTAVQIAHTKTKAVTFATYQATSEGTDVPWWDTLVMATPKSDVRQIVGRITRAWEGKQFPVVFDLLDSTSNVFAGYWNSRRTWYGDINAEVSLPVA